MGGSQVAVGARETRSRSAQRTRAAIVEAATRLFVVHGYQAVSLRDIATEVGMTHPGVLRHFASKQAVLSDVVDQLDRAGVDPGDSPAHLSEIPRTARRHAATPGYVELFSGLSAAATDRDHPAYERYRSRYGEMLKLMTFSVGQELPELDDPRAVALRLIAGWDGLQIMSLYLPTLVDVAEELEVELARIRGDLLPAARSTPWDGLVPEPEPAPAAQVGGYTTGQARREDLLRNAMSAFAQDGFHETSLRRVAELVGVGKTSLLHHFGSKEGLLEAVLRRRDEQIATRYAITPGDPAQQLRQIAARAQESTTEEPGLIRLHVRLSTEATSPHHPAHHYFERRYRQAVGSFIDLIGRLPGASRGGADPVHSSIWFVALWEGLQVQWLYQPASLDIGHHLGRYVEELVSPAAGSAEVPDQPSPTVLL